MAEFVKTTIIDPRVHIDKVRTMFKIDRKFWRSRMILGGLGAHSDADTAFPFTSGVSSLMKSITLYSGKTVIEQVDNVGDYMSHAIWNKDNKTQGGICSPLLASRMSMFYGITQHGQGTNNELRDFGNYVTPRQAVRASGNDTNLSIIDLRMLFPYLKSKEYIPPMPDMSLEIEWNITNAVTDPARSVTSILRPYLIMDEVLNEDLYPLILQDAEMTVWESPELDRLVIPSTALAETKSTTG